eukprot:Pgem_evm2s11989
MVAGYSRLLTQIVGVGFTSIYFIYCPHLWPFAIYLPLVAGIFGTAFSNPNFSSYTNTGLIALIVSGVDSIANAHSYSANLDRDIMVQTTYNRIFLTITGVVIAVLIGCGIYPVHTIDLFYDTFCKISAKLSHQVKETNQALITLKMIQNIKNQNTVNNATVTQQQTTTVTTDTTSPPFVKDSKHTSLMFNNPTGKMTLETNSTPNECSITIDEDTKSVYSRNVKECKEGIQQAINLFSIVDGKSTEPRMFSEEFNEAQAKKTIVSLKECWMLLYITNEVVLRKLSKRKELVFNQSVWSKIDLDTLACFIEKLHAAVNDIHAFLLCYSFKSSSMRGRVDTTNLKEAMALKSDLTMQFALGCEKVLLEHSLDVHDENKSEELIEDHHFQFAIMRLAEKINDLMSRSIKLSYELDIVREKLM